MVCNKHEIKCSQKVLGLTAKKVSMSATKRAGLQFSVMRLHRNLVKETHGTQKVEASAAVYGAGIIEYLVAELLELAGNASKDLKVCKYFSELWYSNEFANESLISRPARSPRVTSSLLSEGTRSLTRSSRLPSPGVESSLMSTSPCLQRSPLNHPHCILILILCVLVFNPCCNFRM